MSSVAAQSPVLAMNLSDADYLSLLQRADRTRRPVRSEEDRLREERERGFSTHFSGANRVEKPKGRRTSVGRLSAQAANVVLRRGWNNEAPSHPVPIETQDEYWEDSFEECEDSLDGTGGSSQELVNHPLTSDLVERVSELDPSQQAMLMDLIDQVVASSPRLERRKDSGLSPPRVSWSDDKDSADRESEPPISSPRPIASRGPLIVETIQPDSDTVDQDVAEVEMSEIKIRIRLNSVWENSGFVSLDAIELVNTVTQYCYDLRNFKMIVLNGLHPFPFAAETVVNVNRLFQRQAGRTPKVILGEPWKAPFKSNTTYIEIQISGKVPKSEEETLSLRVFNGRMASERVKDMDVYVGSICVWSGRWQPNVSFLEFALSAKDQSPRIVSENSIVSSVASLPASSMLVSNSEEVAEGLPLWLSELKTPREKCTDIQVLSNQSNDAPLKRSQSSSVKFFGSETSENVASPVPRKRDPIQSSSVGLKNAPSSAGSRRRRLSEGMTSPISDRDTHKETTSARRKALTPRPRRSKTVEVLNGPAVFQADIDHTDVAQHADYSECRDALADGSTSEIFERIRVRNHRIDDMQEVIAKLNDSLAVLLPSPQRKIDDISPSLDAENRSDAAMVQGASHPALLKKGVSFAPAVDIIDEGNVISAVGVLEIIVHSNWGDEEFVGLNGVEIFNMEGKSMRPSKVSVKLNNEEIHIPNTDVLIDGVNFTKDDSHSWLLPLTAFSLPENICSIVFELNNQDPVSLITIWNYNKSRTHRIRGVKDCKIIYSGKIVFEGYFD